MYCIDQLFYCLSRLSTMMLHIMFTWSTTVGTVWLHNEVVQLTFMKLETSLDWKFQKPYEDVICSSFHQTSLSSSSHFQSCFLHTIFRLLISLKISRSLLNVTYFYHEFHFEIWFIKIYLFISIFNSLLSRRESQSLFVLPLFLNNE